MLVLTRRIGESIFIGDDKVKITALGVKGNQVRIGIDAPDNVVVHREEILRRIQMGGNVVPPAVGSDVDLMAEDRFNR